MLRKMMRRVFPDEVKRVDEGRCPRCGEEIRLEEFDGYVSLKELALSGLCQRCQDEMFEGGCDET